MIPRFKTTLLVTPAILSLVTGCNRSEEKKRMELVAKAKKDSERFEKIDNFVHEGPLFLKNKTLSEVRKLGILKKEKANFEDNPHVDNAKIEFRTFEFEGLEVSGVVDKDSFSAISVTVTTSKWPILFGLDVGSHAARIPSALGQAPRPMNGPIEEFSGETETVKFTVSQGKIIKIEFIYYFD